MSARLTTAEEDAWLDLVRRFLASGYTLDDVDALAAMVTAAGRRRDAGAVSE